MNDVVLGYPFIDFSFDFKLVFPGTCMNLVVVVCELVGFKTVT